MSVTPALLRTSLLLLASACSATLADGAACDADENCSSGFCQNQVCRVASADEDQDGLDNQTERTLTTDPDQADTDGDGRRDDLEVGSTNIASPPDLDADGIPDVLESSAADADGDCLPDERDPLTATTPATLEAIAAWFCPTAGVCSDAVRTATCQGGLPACHIDAAGWQPTELACDGRDNDCDGTTDEGLYGEEGKDVGDSCDAGGACGTGTVECGTDGQARCSKAPLGSEAADQPEICNGIDDDCNGATDDGVLGSASLGSWCAGVGGCRDGILECREGAPRCSSEPGGSTWVGLEEQCNGLDDDCDGVADDVFTLSGLALGQPCGTGQCAGGHVVCAPDGTSAVCSTVVPGTTELCNNLDDDCDGLTDEAVDLEPDLSGCPVAGVCAAPNAIVPVCLGAWVCTPGLESPWQPDTELSCDGKDNDCDGTTDEAFGDPGVGGKTLAVGEPCGVGACADGVVVCTADQSGAVCSTQDLSAEESCNGADDDCDGSTDEGMSYETALLGAPCKGRGGCGTGTVECSAGGAVCSSNPGGSASQAAAESCNAIDDDCDGLTDELEDVVVTDQSCPAAGICDGKAPIVGCVQGALLCDNTAVPGYEDAEVSCDGLDNDCDSAVDEGLRVLPFSLTLESPGRPRPTLGAASAMHPDGRVIVAGGEVAGPGGLHATADAWSFTPTEGWRALTSMAGPLRRGASMVRSPSSSAVLVLGGEAEDGQAIDPIAEFSGDWSTWQPVGTAGRRRDATAAASAVGNTVWFVGGRSLGADAPVAALDLAQKAWLPSVPSGPGWIEGAAGAVSESSSGERLILHGGRLGNPASVSGRTWILDVKAGGWTPLDLAGPGPRTGHSIVALADGRAVLVGGVDGNDVPRDDAWVLDPTQLGWVKLPGLAPTQIHAALTLVGETAETPGGGILLAGLADPTTVGDVWWMPASDLAFDAPFSAWTPLDHGAVPNARIHPAVALRADGTAWVFGGQADDEETLDDVWLRDETGVWSEQVDAGAPRRAGSASAYSEVDDKLWIHGGRDATSAATSGLWVYDESGWASLEATTRVASDHALAVDEAGHRLLHTAEGPETIEVWSIPLAGGPGPLVSTSGDVPPRMKRPGLFVTRDGDRAVLAGVSNGQGTGVWVLDFGNSVWTRVATLDPEPAASFVFHGPAERLFLIVNTSATRVALDGTVDTFPLPTSSNLLAIEGAGAALDTTRGTLTLLGGHGPEGAPRAAIWRIDFACGGP